MRAVRLLICFFLICCLCGCGKQHDIPKADPVYAMEMLRKQCLIVPRHSGTPGAKETAKLLLQEASRIPTFKGRENLCFMREFQEDTPTGPMIFRNVIAVVPGKSKNNPLIIGAHYDAKKLELTPDFQGANDGGSGTAVLLAVMKSLSAWEDQLPFPVCFVFFDGEECQMEYGKQDGLHGSRRTVQDFQEKSQLSEMGKPKAMILADMVGDQDWKISLPVNSSEKLKKIVLKAAEILQLSDCVSEGNLNILDDHVPFLEAGIPAVDLIDFEYGPDNIYWHTSEDTIDKISPESLAKTADLILHTLLLLK